MSRLDVKVEPTLLDRVIGYFAPQNGLARTRARLALELDKRRYEAATRGRRTDGWVAGGTSANAEIAPSLARMRARARDLGRNNTYAKRAIQLVKTSTVGKGGIRCQIVGRTNTQTRRLEQTWKAWADSKQCDSIGRKKFGAIQGLVMKTVAESGECLVRRRRRRSTDGLSVPIQLQVLEPDYLDESRDGPTEAGGKIVQGIELDALDRRVAYWLFREHPGDTVTLRRSTFQSVRVLAEDICHVYWEDRAGQCRGVPWGETAFLLIRDWFDYLDTELLRQKLSACFVGFVHDMEAPTSDVSSSNVEEEELQPGTLRNLPAGKSITFGSPPEFKGLKDYDSVALHAIAAGYGVTYEDLTGDYSQTNYSSGRLGRLAFQDNVDEWQHEVLIPQFCDVVFAWFLEAAELTGLETSGARARWTARPRRIVDPAKEDKADVAAVRGGVKTITQVLMERGRDPEEHFEEYAADVKRIDELGIVLDSDARNRRSGSSKSKPPQTAANES